MNVLAVAGILVLLIKGFLGLKLINLDIPGAVTLGDAIWLNCTFDLENDELYAIKWYRNNVEFYRYLPTDDVVTQKYDMKGVYVDLSKSYQGSLYLNGSDLNTEGVYRCEVSAEAPSFQTVREEKEIRIYVMPTYNPQITGLLSHYQIGEEINTSCRAGASKPPAIISWYVNNELIPKEFYGDVLVEPPKSPVASVTRTLRLVTEPAYFRKGFMKITCNADISVAYSVTHDEIVINNKTLLIGYRPSLIPSLESPVISGGQLKYLIGDLVDVNCTSSKSMSKPVLAWYVNDRKVEEEYLRVFSPIVHPDTYTSYQVGLKFRVRTKHFEKDEMRLRCTSTLSRMVTYSSHETVYAITHPPGVQYSKMSNSGISSLGIHNYLLLLLSLVIRYVNQSLKSS